jgi:hypothetical protein
MLVVTAPDIAKLHGALTLLSEKALPHAAKDGINTAAFAVRREWKAEGERTMTVRNQYTFGGRRHRVVQATLKKRIKDMEAVAGNKNRYMLQQERGVSRFALWRHGVPIPTIRSRKGSNVKRLQQPRYWRRRMKLGKRFNRSDAAFHPSNRGGVRGKSRNQRYVAASVAQAKKQGRKYVYLDFGAGNRGIFDVEYSTIIKKVWNLNRKVTHTKANPMLARTLKKLEPAMSTYQRMALEKQIRLMLKWKGIRVRGANAFLAKI